MTAAALLLEAAKAGVTVRLVEGKPKVAGNPNPELLARLREQKAAIVTILALPPASMPAPDARAVEDQAAGRWTDDHERCRRLGAAGLKAARLVVFAEWVVAAGGRSDADGTLHLPTNLPNCLAAATLRAHARALGLKGPEWDPPHYHQAEQVAAEPAAATQPKHLTQGVAVEAAFEGIDVNAARPQRAWAP